MAIKPILFNAEMVRAILDGRKSCTRRAIKPQPDEKHTYPLGFITDSTEKKEVGCFGFAVNEYGGSIQYVKPPYRYAPGDILYVRETWKKAPNGYFYYEDWLRNDIADVTKWKPSIHMPKEAARIWLKVTDVRVERLKRAYMWQIVKTAMRLSDVMLALTKDTMKLTNLRNYGIPPSRNPTLTATVGMRIRGCGLLNLSGARSRKECEVWLKQY